MKKKVRKQLFSLLTALCLMLAMAPAAFAADSSGLQTLIDNASAGSTIELTSNYTLTEPVTINKAVTIDGNGYSVTAASGQNAFNVTASGVTLNRLTITASGSGYGVNSTGSSLTVSNCAINAAARGINFYPENNPGATLNVSGTIIRNSAVSNYNTTANYSGDNRGISTADVLGGTVTISDSSILGFKYSINAMVSPESSAAVSLRDGQGTVFSVSGSTIKGWTALNIWSAATSFTFTDCTLVGINALSGVSNANSTIQANDGIYGGNTAKSSTVKFIGGSVTAAKLSTAPQSVLNVDVELQTKYIFEQYYNEDSEENEQVAVNYYGSENTAGSYEREVLMWNFNPETTDEVAENYLSTMVSGNNENNVSLFGGTVDEYTNAVSGFYGINRTEAENDFAVSAGGDSK